MVWREHLMASGGCGIFLHGRCWAWSRNRTRMAQRFRRLEPVSRIMAPAWFPSSHSEHGFVRGKSPVIAAVVDPLSRPCLAGLGRDFLAGAAWLGGQINVRTTKWRD